jgi:hypothetical protein
MDSFRNYVISLIDGKYHREDGPAYESENVKVWYSHGIRHRMDGPAIIWYNGPKYWYYNGTHIPCSSQEEFEKLIKLKAFW